MFANEPAQSVNTEMSESSPAESLARPLHVLLGISGGIAAYKSADLVRRLSERGAEVRVVMTRAAQAFITPLTLQALSGKPVRTDLLSPEAEAGMDHIALARWADLVLIAPATADLIARLACGMADDLLTTLVLATEAPVAIAPAMNQHMWAHPSTQENSQRLAGRGVRIIGPDVGVQACGEQGAGRMMEPLAIAEAVLGPGGLQRQPETASDSASVDRLAGRRVLMTVGPTREAIDPVRFIGNRSSGKMGYALAEALRARGAQVTLIAGPTSERAPAGIERVDIESALQMQAAVMAHVEACDLFIATAAVGDYRPEHPAEDKIKKTDDAITLTLVRNPDILAQVAARPKPPFTVGFAAETADPEGYARGKLEAKRLSMIAANRVGSGSGGFESDDNALVCLWPGGGRRELPLMSKPALAAMLADLIAERYAAQITG